MKQANRLMKYPNSLILLASILWLGCDSLEDKKGRFLLKGNEKMEENDPKSAIGFYQEAIGLDSTYADAYYNKAMAHLRLNQLEETIADLTKAIQFRPDYVEAIFQRGLSYLDNGEFYKAREDADKMVNLDPQNWKSHFLKGLSQEKLKDFNASLEAFRMASQLAPENSDLLVNQATIHFYQKKYAESTAILEEAEKLNPSEPNLHNLRSMISMLRLISLALQMTGSKSRSSNSKKKLPIFRISQERKVKRMQNLMSMNKNKQI
jgi:tetratricopeptide (TPR) repeat protein